MVMVNLLYVPFGALMLVMYDKAVCRCTVLYCTVLYCTVLVMYDKAVCRVISNRYNSGSEAHKSKSQ